MTLADGPGGGRIRGGRHRGRQSISSRRRRGRGEGMLSPTPGVTLTAMQIGTERNGVSFPLRAATRPVRVLGASRTLAILNVLAVGGSLGAFVGGLLGRVLHVGTTAGIVSPTFIAGVLWTTLLRWPRTVGTSGIRWGWLASVPIAYVNCAVAIAFSVS